MGADPDVPHASDVRRHRNKYLLSIRYFCLELNTGYKGRLRL
jgi:hypothetical protein